MEHFLFRDLAALNVLFRDSLLVNRGQSLLFLRFILQVSVGATLKIDSSILSKAKGLVSVALRANLAIRRGNLITETTNSLETDWDRNSWKKYCHSAYSFKKLRKIPPRFSSSRKLLARLAYRSAPWPLVA